MLHPNLIKTPHERADTRSELLKQKDADALGSGVNRCPFGCEIHHLDEQGYCDHLVGFTTDKKGYEPLVKQDNGRRKVVVPTKLVNGRPVPVLSRVLPTDVLDRISISYRVYRDVKVEHEPEPEEEVTAPEYELADA